MTRRSLAIGRDPRLMTFLRRSLRLVGGYAALAVALPVASADLLTGGNFEVPSGDLPFWTVEEFYTTGSGGAPNTVTLNTAFQDKVQSPTKSAWLRAFAGGATASPNNLTNAVISQIVPASAGVQYNASAWSQFEAQYSGGVDLLNANSPLGAVASPTVTELRLEFLDVANNVLGAPLTVDVKADRIAQIGFPLANDNNYYQHQLSGVAPAGTAQARIVMAALNMVHNGSSPMSAFVDTFSVTSADAPANELLLNAMLDDDPPSALDGWTVVQNDLGNPANEEVIRANNEGFANHTPGGSSGIWLSSFFGEVGTEVGGSISQSVAAVPGEAYVFSGYAKWEPNYSATLTFMELAFLDVSQSVIGSPVLLDLGQNGQTNDNEWLQHALTGTAPAGTASVRVSAGFEGGVSTTGAQSAFFDDLVLEIASAGLPGDFNGDNFVDGADLLLWQRDGSVGALADWEANFGARAGAVASVPEPTAAALLLVAAGLAIGTPRRRAASH